jgi:hypothetical protein
LGPPVFFLLLAGFAAFSDFYTRRGETCQHGGRNRHQAEDTHTLDLEDFSFGICGHDGYESARCSTRRRRGCRGINAMRNELTRLRDTNWCARPMYARSLRNAAVVLVDVDDDDGDGEAKRDDETYFYGCGSERM